MTRVAPAAAAAIGPDPALQTVVLRADEVAQTLDVVVPAETPRRASDSVAPAADAVVGGVAHRARAGLRDKLVVLLLAVLFSASVFSLTSLITDAGVCSCSESDCLPTLHGRFRLLA